MISTPFVGLSTGLIVGRFPGFRSATATRLPEQLNLFRRKVFYGGA